MSATWIAPAIGPLERAGQEALRHWLRPRRLRGWLRRLKQLLTGRAR